MNYLFEKVEIYEHEIENIWVQLDFIFNSFCKNLHTFNGFGINIYKLDIVEIKNILQNEEPRILIHEAYFENNTLTLLFEHNGDMYEKRFA